MVCIAKLFIVRDQLSSSDSSVSMTVVIAGDRISADKKETIISHHPVYLSVLCAIEFLGQYYAGRVRIDGIALIEIHPIRNNNLGWELGRISLLCFFAQQLRENCMFFEFYQFFGIFLATFAHLLCNFCAIISTGITVKMVLKRKNKCYLKADYLLLTRKTIATFW